MRAGTSKGSTISQYGCSTFGALVTERQQEEEEEEEEEEEVPSLNNNTFGQKINLDTWRKISYLKFPETSHLPPYRMKNMTRANFREWYRGQNKMLK